MAMLSPRALALLTVASTIGLTASAASAQDWQPLALGVDYATLRSFDSTVYVTRVDLCAPGVRMRATAPGEGPRTVSSFADHVGATVAINGDWWARDGFNPDLPQTTFPRGLALGFGQHFPGTADPNFYGFIAFGQHHTEHSPDEAEVGGPAPWMWEVVSGQPTLAWDGQLRNNPNGHCSATRARTATGLSADGQTLFLAVADEIAGSAGMTCDQWGQTLLGLGAHTVMNHDGGGSSTMVVQGAVVNHPTDGGQRSVVTHLALLASSSGPAAHCRAHALPGPDGRIRRPIADGAAWGLQLGDIQLVDGATMTSFATGAELPATAARLVSESDRPHVYVLDGGVRRHVVDGYSMANWRFDWARIEVMPPGGLAGVPEGAPWPHYPHLIWEEALGLFLVDVVPLDLGGGGGGGGGTPDPDAEAPDGSDPGAAGCAASGGGAGGVLVLTLVGLVGLARRRRRR
jgi:MYXO-CTERM domain-containing protein